MIEIISISGVAFIIFLPIVLNSLLKINDYYGFIMGIRYLIISLVVSPLLGLLIPNKNITTETLDKILEYTDKEKYSSIIFLFLCYIIYFCLLYFSISSISKPHQNYNAIFLFISGAFLNYIIPFGISIALPMLAKNETIAAGIKKNNAEKYFSEERCMFLVKKAILSMLYDAGTCLLFLLHIKKLINKLILPLMYFLPLLFKSAIILAGLISLENYLDLIDALPFVCGLFYYFKLVGNGELKITKLKDEGEEEEEEEK
jgi:hypothetical protein